MSEILEMLKKREVYLLSIKKQKETELVDSPKAKLRIEGEYERGKQVKYFVRTEMQDYKGAYIKAQDKSLAIKLAQKDYDEKVLKSIDKELQAIMKYKSNYPQITAEQVYEKLHKERQKLVKPIAVSDREFLRQWEEYEYAGKNFDDNMPELYTDRNERVRSKSEVIIADSLYKANIPYRYECPLEFKNGLVVYPDFTLLNKKTRENIYWEHLGMMDDATYAENAIQKINTYMQNGIYVGKNLLLTFETRNNPINHRTIDIIINNYVIRNHIK